MLNLEKGVLWWRLFITEDKVVFEKGRGAKSGKFRFENYNYHLIEFYNLHKAHILQYHNHLA